MTSIIFCCANSWNIFIFPSELITEASGVAEGSSWNRKAMKKAPRVDSLECRRKKFWQKKERHLLTDKIKNTCVQCKRYPHYRMILYISIITIVSGVLSICLFCSLPAVSALLTSICAGCITGIVFYILANVRNKGDRHHLAPGCVPLRKGRTPPGPAGISAHRRL